MRRLTANCLPNVSELSAQVGVMDICAKPACAQEQDLRLPNNASADTQPAR